MNKRYSRQIIFTGIGQAGQEKLGKAKVVIVGAGALGTVSANNLVRAGVGHVRIIDRDFVEFSNLQRQSLFDENDARNTLPKAAAAVAKLKTVNCEVECEGIIGDLNSGNAVSLLSGFDLVVDGTDNFEARFIMNDACWKLNIPWIYGGAVGASGMAAAFLPGKTGCLRCLFDSPPGPGLAPTCDTAGIINPASGLVSALQSAEALKILVGSSEMVNPGLVSFDLWDNRFDNFDLQSSKLKDCPCCGRRDFEFLKPQGGTKTAYLCGRDAVQVVPAEENLKLELALIAERLQMLGKVELNAFLLRFVVDNYELVLFKDGRAIVKGTNNEGVAKGLYARYFGL